MKDNNMSEWIDNNKYDDAYNWDVQLDEWFASSVWKGICRDADAGCSDSLELMEHVSTRLCSLIFHLENDSPKHRIDYDLNELKLFINKFN